MSLKKQIVKKSNALINASYTITLAEQRLILLAIARAKGDLANVEDLTVYAGDYAEQWGVSLPTAYEALQHAATQLFERRFTFQQETAKGLKTTVSRWVSHVAYLEGESTVELAFAPHVRPLLCDLKEKFTHYALEQIADLNSVHAVRLYELLISWRSTGKTPVMEVAELRQRLGIEEKEYPRMTDFKRRVLDYAINQINEHTDITASYEQHKRGRRIVGFEFKFEMKRRDRDPDTVDWVNGKPDAAPSEEKPKRKVISKKQAEAMAGLGETYPELYRRLSRDYIIK